MAVKPMLPNCSRYNGLPSYAHLFNIPLFVTFGKVGYFTCLVVILRVVPRDLQFLDVFEVLNEVVKVDLFATARIQRISSVSISFHKTRGVASLHLPS